MKGLVQVLVAIALFFLVEFFFMILFNIFFRDTITIDGLFGKIFFTSIVVIFGGGFLFILIKAQILYMRKKPEHKNDTSDEY